MAASAAHQFGQIIGNFIEWAIEPTLQEVCDRHYVFLDKKGAREGYRKGTKLRWKDSFGSEHDLDFVIERPSVIGQEVGPLGFIEAAWRRYTKHSKNKAQEIQGAILPIHDKYLWDMPFKGAVLAGDFTKPSLNQLRAVGFEVLYIPVKIVEDAFSSAGIDIRFDEQTEDAEFLRATKQIKALTNNNSIKIRDSILLGAQPDLDNFIASLEAVLGRNLVRLTITPMFGDPCEFSTIQDALSFLHEFSESGSSKSFKQYDIRADYSNKDRVEARFSEKSQAASFLMYLRGS